MALDRLSTSHLRAAHFLPTVTHGPSMSGPWISHGFTVPDELPMVSFLRANGTSGGLHGSPMGLRRVSHYGSPMEHPWISHASSICLHVGIPSFPQGPLMGPP